MFLVVAEHEGDAVYSEQWNEVRQHGVFRHLFRWRVADAFGLVPQLLDAAKELAKAQMGWQQTDEDDLSNVASLRELVPHESGSKSSLAVPERLCEHGERKLEKWGQPLKGQGFFLHEVGLDDDKSLWLGVLGNAFFQQSLWASGVLDLDDDKSLWLDVWAVALYHQKMKHLLGQHRWFVGFVA